MQSKWILRLVTALLWAQGLVEATPVFLCVRATLASLLRPTTSRSQAARAWVSTWTWPG